MAGSLEQDCPVGKRHGGGRAAASHEDKLPGGKRWPRGAGRSHKAGAGCSRDSLAENESCQGCPRAHVGPVSPRGLPGRAWVILPPARRAAYSAK